MTWGPRTALLRRVGLHTWIVCLLLGLLSSNLENDPLDKILEPYFGRPFAAMGLRQYWAMFAPDPVHNARFVRLTRIAPDGTRTVLQEADEPPFPPGSKAWMGLGYSRMSKWDKQLARKPERWGKPTTEALCRLNGLEGSLEATVISYTTPPPAKRAAGVEVTRSERAWGPWACP